MVTMSDQNTNQTPEASSGGPARPGVVTAFGVLHIVFGGLSIIGAIIGLAGSAAVGGMARGFGASTGGAVAVAVIFSILALAVAVVLLIAGILLIGGKKPALKLSLVYVIASLGVRVLNIIVGLIMGVGLGWTFTIIGIAYPLVVLFVLVMNDDAKAYIEKQNP
jgi:hypothetical protein